SAISTATARPTRASTPAPRSPARSVGSAKDARDIGALRRSAVSEHEPHDAARQQRVDLAMRQREVVLVEVLLRLARMDVAGERTASKQIAYECDLAA